MSTLESALRAIGSTVAVLAMVGCSSGVRSTRDRESVTSPQGGRDARAANSSPLVVRVEEPALLATVNSLYVEPPTVKGSAFDQSELFTIVQRSTERELGLKVLPAAPTRKTGIPAVVPAVQLKKDGIDGVLHTTLLTYAEGTGSSAGGTPAAVAFTMSITRVSDNQQVWHATYSLRQEPLTSNLLKIGERLGKEGGWRSARQALDDGLVEALRDFGYRREQQFFKKTK